MLMERDIKKLIRNYWNGDTSLEEEKWLIANCDQIDDQVAKSYFQQIKSKQQLRMPEKKRHNRMNWRQLAAAVALLITPLVWYVTRENQRDIAKRYEVENPQEAFEVTQTALKMISKNFEKAKSQTKQISKFNKVEEKLETTEL